MSAFNTLSRPSDLRITDLRVVDIDGTPKHCTLLKIFTNQGLVGYGEVRDASSRTYALMLKSRIVGENPCNVDKIFRRIKQFGHHSRQGGGVSGIEVALWDLAGKAYGVPVYQLLGGKYRDSIRLYCDTDVEGRHGGKEMGEALKARMDAGYTFLKMDLGISLLANEPGTLTAPLGFLDELKRNKSSAIGDGRGSKTKRDAASTAYSLATIAHPFTGIRITPKGFDLLEQYVKDVRSVIGWDVPLAIDHFGHVCVEDCIRFGRLMEGYNIAWMEDLVPWQYTDQYVRLAGSVAVPICTGEDIYLKEGFMPLLSSGGVSVIHPDVLTAGGIAETKKIAELADEAGVAVALHMAESPVGFLAAVHLAATLPNILALEFHSADVDWWEDLVNSPCRPLIRNGYAPVPEVPGLGIESLNEELIAAHVHRDIPGVWEDTSAWDNEWSNDRLWS